jgi:hypothetical protein
MKSINIMRIFGAFTAILLFAWALSAQHAADEPLTGSAVLKGPYLGQQPPGDTPILFAPGIVSTGKEHSAAMFTPDGKEVWFGRLLPAELYYMERVGDTWTEPKIAPFSLTYNMLYPVLSDDGNKIFFSSDRPFEDYGERLSRWEGNIWMVERTSGGWSEPKYLDENINHGRHNSCGSMTANGNLYFTSKDNEKSTEIYRASMIGGAYGVPENLTEINSPTPEFSPFVAPDESYLIFSSFRGGLGRSDLFISFRSQDGTWSKPKNMGSKINSPYKDEYPCVTPDGKYLFFNSNRPSSLNPTPIEGGPGNIYWVSAAVIEELK